MQFDAATPWGCDGGGNQGKPKRMIQRLFRDLLGRSIYQIKNHSECTLYILAFDAIAEFDCLLFQWEMIGVH